MEEKRVYFNRSISETVRLPANSYELGIESYRHFSIRRKFYRESVIVMYVTEGRLFYESSGMKDSIEAGQFVFLDQRVEHAYWFDDRIPTEIYWMHMSGDLLLKTVDSYSPYFTLPFTGEGEDVLEGIKTAFSYVSGETADSYRLSGHVIELANLILMRRFREYLESLRHNDSEAEFVESFNRVIAGGRYSTLSLDGICREMNLSKFWFSHRFSAIFRMSPMQYISDVKFKRAMHYLTSTDYSIQKVSEMSGFTSQSYFSYAFKKEWGMTPEQYRKYIDPQQQQ